MINCTCIDNSNSWQPEHHKPQKDTQKIHQTQSNRIQLRKRHMNSNKQISVAITFSLILQTINIAQMVPTGREGISPTEKPQYWYSDTCMQITIELPYQITTRLCLEATDKHNWS